MVSSQVGARPVVRLGTACTGRVARPWHVTASAHGTTQTPTRTPGLPPCNGRRDGDERTGLTRRGRAMRRVASASGGCRGPGRQLPSRRTRTRARSAASHGPGGRWHLPVPTAGRPPGAGWPVALPVGRPSSRSRRSGGCCSSLTLDSCRRSPAGQAPPTGSSRLVTGIQVSGTSLTVVALRVRARVLVAAGVVGPAGWQTTPDPARVENLASGHETFAGTRTRRYSSESASDGHPARPGRPGRVKSCESGLPLSDFKSVTTVISFTATNGSGRV